ncbi:MAG: ABC transporter ATP-binding protein [Eubacteriaceae bacterium]|nr:ABC transporter ATP-binding protein [Eubacteriaceae bacterium]
MMVNLLEIRNLHTCYHAQNQVVRAVDGVDLHIRQGDFYALVGESGCGKSTVARSIARIIDPSYAYIEQGEILFEGNDLVKLNPRQMRAVRGLKIGMVFQNPMTSLNPVVSIGKQLLEAIQAHTRLPRKQAMDKAISLLELVKIPDPAQRMQSYPHQLSGGMQQRVVIAIALANDPKLLIADEPTTALDVSVQEQILKEIDDIRKQRDMSILLITHNMGIVAQMCNRVAVMYGGVIVEDGFSADIFSEPLHPYTQGLMACMPSIEEEKEELHVIPGTVPKHFEPGECRFLHRCPIATPDCGQREPGLEEFKENHFVRCHNVNIRRLQEEAR